MINVLGRAKQTSCKKYTVIYLQNIIYTVNVSMSVLYVNIELIFVPIYQ